jgi:hypothetical protein
MAKNTSTIDVKIAGLKELKQQLKELESQLATASDPKQMQDLSAEAGKLRSEIKAANTQLEVMSSTDPFKKASNSFGIMSEQLASLDFKGAANSANLFANSVKGITPEALGGKLKSLGSAVLSLGKAFMSLGTALLANPIFLIAAAIIAIVTIIGVLLNKLGLLKPILNAIGKAFEFVKSVIDAVVQSMKDFLDWLGLTSFAAEEAAGRQAAAQEKVAQAFENKRNKVVSAYDQEIALAQIAGEDTTKIEKKKQLAIIETSRAQYRALEAQRDALRAAGVLTAEQSKSINDQMKVLREGIEGARFEIKKIDAKNTADKVKTDADETKRQADVAAERRKKAVEEAKRRAEEEAKAILEAAKAAQAARDEFLNTLEGIENSFYDRGKSKRDLELQAVKDHFFQLLETARQYGEDTTILEEEQRLRLQEINAKFDEEEAEKDKQQRLKQEQDDKEAKEKTKQNALDEIKIAETKRDMLIQIANSFNESALALGQIFIKDSKKLEQFQKAQALVQIGIDTAKAISALVAASQANAANGVTGGLAGAVQFASGLAMILTNMAKAKQLLSSPSAAASGGGGGMASSSSTSTQAMQPSFSLFGQANQGNNASSSQSVEQSQSMTIFAKVSAVDMTAEQASNQKNMQMATL